MPSGRPRNLDELKDFIRHAKPGSGQVQKAISEAQTLGIRGFTTLLQAVAHERTSKAWEKALEIKSAMDARTDLRGNVYTYTVSRAAQRCIVPLVSAAPSGPSTTSPQLCLLNYGRSIAL